MRFCSNLCPASAIRTFVVYVQNELQPLIFQGQRVTVHRKNVEFILSDLESKTFAKKELVCWDEYDQQHPGGAVTLEA